MKTLHQFRYVLIGCVLYGTPLAAQEFNPKSELSGQVYTTAQGTDFRLHDAGKITFANLKQPSETDFVIFVDPSQKFQRIVGIGGALTDAVAETFYKIPARSQKDLLQAFYDKDKGIGYTLARTNIQSCDFSSGIYSYVQEDDKALKTFNISHDLQYRIPFIKKAISAAGGQLTLYASPWSPPAFMKDNKEVLHGGKLLADYADTWANFYVKFIRAYEEAGVPVWGLTVQNEPMAKQIWESCIYTAEEERDFVKFHLGPVLQRNGLGDKKLIVWDHNRDMIYQRASTILADSVAASYVWGIGFHWYETWTKAGPQFQNTILTGQAFPLQNLMFTEGCNERFDPGRLGDWALGERYGQSMISDFNAGTVGWTDWNIFLDENGGPNHVGNYCFAPVHVNTKNGALTFTNAYYYIGHFSKFVRPGARRIISSASRDQLLTTAFINPNGQLSVVIMNKTDTQIDHFLWIKGQAARMTSRPHSITTVIIDHQQ